VRTGPSSPAGQNCGGFDERIVVEQFIRAIHFGDTASVTALLKQGLDLDVRDPLGRTALMLAASSEHGAIVDLLLEAGADPNAVDRSGHTALMRAAAHQRHQIVQALLDAGADPLVEDTAHHTAFWHSMQRTVDFRFPFIKFGFPFIRGAWGFLCMPRVWRTRSARLIRAAISSRSSGTGQGRSHSL